MTINRQSIDTIPGRRSQNIIKAAYRMARIFVRLFGSYLQTSVLTELVAQAGLEAAEARCREEGTGQKITLSKLSMMTGMPTATIKNLQQHPKSIENYQVCAEAAILERWSKDPKLRSQLTGKPMDLPIFGKDGSFQSLVSRHAGRGISTQTALDRLQATGNVQVVNKHFLRMLDPIWRFIEDNEDECLDYGTQSLTSLADCIHNNLIHRHDADQKFTERRICSFRIEDSQANRRKINQLLLDQKEEMIKLMKSLENENENKSEHEQEHERETIIGTGYYFWSKKGCQTKN